MEKINPLNVFLGALLLALIITLVYFSAGEPELFPNLAGGNEAAAVLSTKAAPTKVEKPWLFTFDTDGTLEEAGSPKESSSVYWWLNSGGTLAIENGTGRSARRGQSVADRWFRAYRTNNALDTDSGRYPQNLFRLISQSEVGDADISMAFRMLGINLTDTPNRDVWSGVFLFSRYRDSDNLYYAGIRQDGHVIIKKKIGGQYHTLAEKEYFKSLRPYERDTNPNFIPGQTWLQLRLVTKREDDDIRLTLYLKENAGWEEVLSVLDDGVGGNAFTEPGRFGIRTDYMDVEFDNYQVTPI